MHLTQYSRNSGCVSKTNDGCLLTDHTATYAADVPAYKVLNSQINLSLGRPSRSQWTRHPIVLVTYGWLDPEWQLQPPTCWPLQACCQSWSPRSDVTALAG